VVKLRLALVASLAPAGLLAVSLAACGNLLGLKDLELYPAEGGADSGEDATPDGPVGDTGAPPGDAASDVGDGTTDGPSMTDAPALDSPAADAPGDSSLTVDSPEETILTVDAPEDTSHPLDSSTTPDSSCTGSPIDPHNCGACGHDCLDGLCQGGLCQPFSISSGVTAYDMVVNSGTLYWVDQGSPGSVWTCTITGNACNASTFATNQNTPERITLGGSGNGTVYWSDFGDGTADGAIMSLPLAGGTPATVASSITTPQGVAADGTYVFWAETGATPPQVVRRPVGGGTTSSILTGTSSTPTAVAVGGGMVYWSDAPLGMMGSVGMAAENTLTAMSVSTGQTLPWAIAVDATYVYWVDFTSTGAVWQYTINGGGKRQLSGSEDLPLRIVSDATSAFWIDQGTASGSNGSLVEWEVAAGMSRNRAAFLEQPTALAMDSNAVYFATLGDNHIYMMVR
jgi:hypothetical protein